jgi:hypothetical protein
LLVGTGNKKEMSFTSKEVGGFSGAGELWARPIDQNVRDVMSRAMVKPRLFVVWEASFIFVIL